MIIGKQTFCLDNGKGVGNIQHGSDRCQGSEELGIEKGMARGKVARMWQEGCGYADPNVHVGQRQDHVYCCAGVALH